MSERPTLVTDAHFRYLAERTVQEDKLLSDLKAAALAAGIPAIWIAPEQASFMQILLRLRRAKTVVEVGTLAGYSAIWMARALPRTGRVKTIEINPAFADFAEQWIRKSNVRGRVEVLRGDARAVMPRIRSASADAVFLDADKAGYPVYLKEALRILRPGGLVMADNAFAFGELFSPDPQDRETRAVREFNEIIAKERRLQGVIVPLGDGLWVGVKR